MESVLAMILAGGQPDAMGSLTRNRSMAAVPFGGIYRIIDFTLTNLMHSRIDHVGILTQYRSSSLMDHVGTGRPWEYNGLSRTLMFLPPYEGVGETAWYSGTASAIYKNLNFIKHHKPGEVLVLSGDHVYRMDYRPLLEQHRRTGADVTIALKPMHGTDLSIFGTARLDRNNKVVEYREKSHEPCSNLVSMTIYVFKTDILVNAVAENATKGKTRHLYDEVLPALVSRGRVFGYVFRDPWEYLRPVSAWYDAHMKIIIPGRDPVPTHRVLTNPDTQGLSDVPAAWISRSGMVSQSMVAPGCKVYGSVTGSVLSPRVVVEPGAVVLDSVIMDRCYIGRDARVLRTVLDKDCHIGPGVKVGDGRELVVLGKGTTAGENVPQSQAVPVRPWVGSGVYAAVTPDQEIQNDLGWSG